MSYYGNPYGMQQHRRAAPVRQNAANVNNVYLAETTKNMRGAMGMSRSAMGMSRGAMGMSSHRDAMGMGSTMGMSRGAMGMRSTMGMRRGAMGMRSAYRSDLPVAPGELIEDPNDSGYLLDPATGILYDPETLLPVTPLPDMDAPGYMFQPAYVGEEETPWYKLDSQVGINHEVAVINDEEIIRTPITITHARDQQIEVERQTRQVTRFSEPVVTMETLRGTPVTEYLRGTVGATETSQEIIQDFTINCS